MKLPSTSFSRRCMCGFKAIIFNFHMWNLSFKVIKICTKNSNETMFWICIYKSFICIVEDEIGAKTLSALSSFNTPWQQLDTKLRCEPSLLSALPPCLEEINCLSGGVQILYSHLIVVKYFAAWWNSVCGNCYFFHRMPKVHIINMEN